MDGGLVTTSARINGERRWGREPYSGAPTGSHYSLLAPSLGTVTERCENQRSWVAPVEENAGFVRLRLIAIDTLHGEYRRFRYRLPVCRSLCVCFSIAPDTPAKELDRRPIQIRALSCRHRIQALCIRVGILDKVRAYAQKRRQPAKYHSPCCRRFFSPCRAGWRFPFPLRPSR